MDVLIYIYKDSSPIRSSSCALVYEKRVRGGISFNTLLLPFMDQLLGIRH